jgi:ABC-type sugar transport system ATPase subunit
LIVEDLQTFDYYNNKVMYEKAQFGQYVGPVYFHDKFTRGVYTTKGVTFSLGKTERFVVLDASRAGPADLFACIAGQKTPLCGHIAINGTDSNDLLTNYE